jgi:hypothetical protein
VKTLEQDVVVDGVESRQKVEEDQSGNVTAINSSKDVRKDV